MTMAVMPVRGRLPRRVAMVSVHTSPLDQPGTGDAGGMNVYVVELARRLAALGRRGRDLHPGHQLATCRRRSSWRPGCTVRHVTAGPFEGLAKEDLPAQLCAFTSGVMRAEAARPPGWYDLVHSHYWLSGQVGWLAAERWDVPLVHIDAHAWPRSRTSRWPTGDAPEPAARAIGEAQVVDGRRPAGRQHRRGGPRAGRALRRRPATGSRWSPPGVDLDLFRRARRTARPPAALGRRRRRRRAAVRRPDPAAQGARRAAPRGRPAASSRGRRCATGWWSPSSAARPAPGWPDPSALQRAGRRARHRRPRAVRAAGARRPSCRDWYRAADVTVVPSYSESFGLVAIESQACGTPVVAAAVGGLRTAVADGVSGVLVDGHDPDGVRRACSAGLAGGPRPPAPRSAAARCCTPGGSAGPRPRPGCSRSTPTRCSSARCDPALAVGR